MKQTGKTVEVNAIFRPETGILSTTQDALKRAQAGLIQGDSVITLDRQFKLCFRDKIAEQNVKSSDCIKPDQIKATPFFAPTRFYLISQVQHVSTETLMHLKNNPATTSFFNGGHQLPKAS